MDQKAIYFKISKCPCTITKWTKGLILSYRLWLNGLSSPPFHELTQSSFSKTKKAFRFRFIHNIYITYQQAQSSVRSHSPPPHVEFLYLVFFCSFCSVFQESFLVFELWAFEVFDFVTDPPPTSNLYTLAIFWVHVRLKFSILYRT